MMDVNDVRALRVARAELSKKGIDTMRADVRVTHGVLHIRGLVTAMPGTHIEDIKTEVEHWAHVIRQKPEIRDVILECSYPQGLSSRPVASVM